MSTTHATPMSPTPSMASDITNPTSPQTFPMSPPDMSDDSSQHMRWNPPSSVPLAVTKESGKKLAVGLVYPVQNNSHVNVVDPMSTFQQRQNSVTSGGVALEHSMGIMDITEITSQGQTIMSIGPNVPGFPPPPDASVFNQRQVIYANTTEDEDLTFSALDGVNLDSSGLPEIEPGFL